MIINAKFVTLNLELLIRSHRLDRELPDSVQLSPRLIRQGVTDPRAVLLSNAKLVGEDIFGLLCPQLKSVFELAALRPPELALNAHDAGWVLADHEDVENDVLVDDQDHEVANRVLGFGLGPKRSEDHNAVGQAQQGHAIVDLQVIDRTSTFEWFETGKDEHDCEGRSHEQEYLNGCVLVQHADTHREANSTQHKEDGMQHGPVTVA